MNLKDTLKTVKEKMEPVEYLSYLETKKREAELTGNVEDLKTIRDAYKELEMESDKKIKEIGTEVKDKMKEVFSILGLDKIFEIVETDEKENKKQSPVKEERKSAPPVMREEEKPVKKENFSATETSRLKKEFLINGKKKHYSVEVNSNTLENKIYHQLKVLYNDGKISFETTLHLEDVKSRLFSELFASDLIKNCDLFLEMKAKSDEEFSAEDLKKYLNNFGYVLQK